MTIEEYTAKKAKIDALAKEVTRAEGSLATLMDDLKSVYEVDSIEKAKELLEQYKNDLAELDEDIASKLEKLNSVVDWSSV